MATVLLKVEVDDLLIMDHFGVARGVVADITKLFVYNSFLDNGLKVDLTTLDIGLESLGRDIRLVAEGAGIVLTEEQFNDVYRHMLSKYDYSAYNEYIEDYMKQITGYNQAAAKEVTFTVYTRPSLRR